MATSALQDVHVSEQGEAEDIPPSDDTRLCEVVGFDRAVVRGSDFSCGNEDLDKWLRESAGQNERRHNARTHLALDSRGQLLGYYTLVTYRLDLDEAAAAFGVGKRSYPVSAVLLARLAVDTRWQGRGVGSELLLDALRQVAESSQILGFEVLVVDAIDHAASVFYRRAGFQPFMDHPTKLFMPTGDLRATLGE